MNVIDLIIKKRDGKTLSEREIRYVVDGCTSGAVPDYQISALLMAIYFNGLNPRETLLLTQAMTESGDRLDLSGIRGIKVDKHSTGGVGDKTTLILAPLVAACGIPVAKMSGRSLGHTGGTIDKLEAIPGFQTRLSQEQFFRSVNELGVAISGQTGHLAPADKKLYALRDVTGTVEQLSLIASSIMSKKLASGADAILLDVKTGSGAFMKTPEEAVALAREMVSIGTLAGKKIRAVISDMEQPLGWAVGNALEVMEAIHVLKGGGPEDLTELCLVLASHMLVLGEACGELEEAKDMAQRALRSGAALEKMRQLIENQGGDPTCLEDDSLFPTARIRETLTSSKKGWLSAIQAETVGRASLALGAGRQATGDTIDLSVGILLRKKVGDPVSPNEVLCDIHGNDPERIQEARRLLEQAFQISEHVPEKNPLIHEVIFQSAP